jgi:hypothetical protein
MLSFLVFVVSFFVSVVNWRGRRYKVRGDGTVVPLERRIPLKESRS